MKKDFCERLRELRGKLSQGVFSKEIGVKQTTYSAWETGRSEPPIDMLCTISAKFMVSTDWLLGISSSASQSTSIVSSPGTIIGSPGAVLNSHISADADCENCKYKRLADAFKAL